MTFGIIIGAEGMQRWQQQCLRELQEEATLRLVVTQPEPAESAIERRLRRKCAAMQTVSHSFAPEVKMSDSVEVDRAAECAEVDFMLCLASPIPAADRLPPHGLWYFLSPIGHPDTPTSFWEIAERRSVTEAALCRRMPGTDEHDVLERGVFRTVLTSYRLSRDNVLSGCVTWPRRACRRLREKQDGMVVRLSGGQPRRVPGVVRRLAFGFALFRNYIGAQLAALFFVDQWNVGWLDSPPEKLLNDQKAGQVNWFPALPRQEFIADPFPIPDGSGEVLVEGFDYRHGRGFLSARDGETGESRGERLVREHHLSYPVFVRWNDRLYCVPEAAGSAKLEAYAYAEGTLGAAESWFEEPVFDATIFEFENRWWMLATRPGRYADTQLHAWFAEGPQGPWWEHPLNPLKSDVRSSRPGGSVFQHEDQLYRPAQDCADTYGGALCINRVLELTPDSFQEETVARISPDPDGQYPDGIHTLSGLGGRWYVDGKRRRFVPVALLNFLGGKCRRVLKRVTGR